MYTWHIRSIYHNPLDIRSSRSMDSVLSTYTSFNIIFKHFRPGFWFSVGSGMSMAMETQLVICRKFRFVLKFSSIRKLVET